MEVAIVVVIFMVLAVVLAVGVVADGWLDEFVAGYREARTQQRLEHVEQVRHHQRERVREVGRRYRRQIDRL